MALASGSRLGRIRIDDLLGIGGMGEVYRGWDEKLERAVALKVVHADKRLSTAMHSRFLREARVLSKLDHPNICRIYDVLEREDGDYLVLELVEGATLRERMREPLPRAEALDIALHVARVLAVTHARGIVHRDLKPDNIMVTPEGQVKVLDFGLARPLVEPEHAHDHAATAEDFTADDLEKTAVLGRAGSSTVRDDTHTSAGSLVGTLHYMSPEQARGLPLSEATDVYSLGVVLYEMLGGNRAYAETESLNDLLVRVRRADVQPFDFRDRALNALVKRMLALYPSDRPRAEDVVREVEAIVARPARVRRRVFATLGAAAIVLTIVGAFFVSRHLASTTRLFASKNARGRLAILPFRNATGDASLRWTEEGLEALVTEGVSRVRGADVVAAEDVVRTVRNLKIDPARELTDEQRRALLGALGVDVAILPTVVSDGGKYTIRYAALRADRAETPREATSTVLVEAARAMSVQLAQRIDPSTSADAVSARYSLDATANMLFAMGMQEARVKGSRVAAHYFTVCVDRDPEFLLAKLYLADAHQQVAEHARANELLADVMARAKQRNDRALIARGLLTRADWAIGASDYASATRDGTEALALARSLGDDDLAATALTRLGSAAWRSGQLDRARSLDVEALQIFTRLRNTHRQAELNNNLGIIADSAQVPEEGQKRYEAALAIAERINDRWIIATVTGNLGTSYGTTGDFARAETMTRRQLAMARELGDKDTEIVALVNLGLWLWAQGKEAEAVRFTEQAADAVARAGNPRVETVLHANLAFAHAKLGNAEASRKHGDIASAKMQAFADPEVDRDVQLGLAYAQIRAGRLDEAERTLDRAERWQRSDRTEMMRARLAYARGDYARAFERITKSKTMGGPWLLQNEQMRRAFEESARTGKPSSLAFESPWHERG